MKNFTIVIYAFHLRHTLGDANDEVLPDANLLWESLCQLGEQNFSFPELKDLRSQLICYNDKGVYTPQQEQGRQTHWLTDCGSLDLGTISPGPDLNIKASLQPFRLNDTYAADLTLVPEVSHQQINLNQVHFFQPSYLLPSSLQASLGKTVWLYGEVEKGESKRDFAEKLAASFLATTQLRPIFVSEDELFGIPLFEYQVASTNSESLQILISLNARQVSIVDKATQSYDWLLNLLCCYHKINYIHRQASDRYLANRYLYGYLEKKLQIFADSTRGLGELEELLRELPLKKLDYTRCLQDLQAHQTAIATNIENYHRCLEKIAAITGAKPQSWLDFLERSTQQYQKQISTNLNYFSPGQELFQSTIETIRGIVEIKQAKRDRSLEMTIQVLGVSLGTTAIVSSVIGAYKDVPYTIGVQKPFHPTVTNLFWSLIIGAIAGAITWLIVRPRHRS